MKPVTSLLRFWLLVLSALTLLTLMLLSLALHRGWLTPLVNHFSEPYLISVGEIRLDLYPLELQVDALQAGSGDKALQLQTLRVRSSWQSLWQKKPELFVRLEDGGVSYARPSAGTTKEHWQLAGQSTQQWLARFTPAPADPAAQAPAVPADAESQWGLRLNTLQITDFRLNSLQEDLPGARVQRLQFGPLDLTQPKVQSAVTLELETLQGAVKLNGSLSPLAARPQLDLTLTLSEIRLQDQLLYLLPEGADSKLYASLAVALKAPADAAASVLTVKGDIRSDGLRWPLPGKPLSWQQAGLTGLLLQADLDSEYQPGDVSLQLKQLVLDQPSAGPDTQTQLALKQLRLEQLKVGHRPEGVTGVQLDYLGLQQLSLQQNTDQIRWDMLSGRGLQLSLNPPAGKNDAEPALAASAQTDATGETAAPADSAGAVGATEAGEQRIELSLQGLLLQGLDLQQSPQRYRLRLAQLAPLKLAYQNHKLTVDTGPVQLEEGTLDLILAAAEKAVSEPSPDQASAGSTVSAPEDSQPDNGTAATQTPLHVVFSGEQLTLKDHLIYYRDLNLTEAPRTEIRLEQFEITEPAWPARSALPWQTVFWMNGQSRWQIRGSVQTHPFALVVDGQQQGISLPDLSPYSEHYAEVKFSEGAMDNQFAFTLQDQALKGALKLKFYNPDITLQGSLSGQNIPLQMAFSVLEDSKGRIELEIDLDKKGDELNVGTGAIVKELLLAASQKGAVSYLKYMLQPYGTLMTLSDIGSRVIRTGKIPLEPIRFAVGQETLSSRDQGYAEKIAAILKDKSHLQLNYCLYPAEEELAQLQLQLKDPAVAAQRFEQLNQQRRNSLRRYFAEQGFAARLKSCTEPDPKAEPAKVSLMRLYLAP